MPTYPLLKISSFTRPITSSNVLPKSIMRIRGVNTLYEYYWAHHLPLSSVRYRKTFIFLHSIMGPGWRCTFFCQVRVLLCPVSRRSISIICFAEFLFIFNNKPHIFISIFSTQRQQYLDATAVLISYINFVFLQYTISWRRETSSDQPSYSILKVDVFLC